MKFLNFGSLNIDHVYTVPRFVSPGETLAASHYQRHAGGKGLNQSLAAARAGATIFHAGCIGQDGHFLCEQLQNAGVSTEWITTTANASGHASIQVNPEGENSIVIFGGANQEITEPFIDEVLDNFSPGDFILLQNEINHIPTIMEKAHAKGMKVIFNATPCKPELRDEYPLHFVSTLIVNEIEAGMLANLDNETDPRVLMTQLMDILPIPEMIMTLGSRGVLYGNAEQFIFVPALSVTPIDTTAAGDTFIGFYLAHSLKGFDVHDCLTHAVKAAALCVTRKGAAQAIPTLSEVEKFYW